MTPGIKPLVAGNWKMNGVEKMLGELSAVADFAGANDGLDRDKSACDILLCVPFTLLERASAIVTRSAANIGAQDCHKNRSGAHTGDISVEMIADCGATAVIVGHSERRTDHGESDEQVCEKARAALTWGHMTVVCIGESESQRKDGTTLDVLGKQMAGSIADDALGSEMGELVIAYEPIWAIGTGLTPTLDDIAQVHQFIREDLQKRFGDSARTTRILYGGSVKPDNARQILQIANVDGALVGGASLKAVDFLGICSALD